ncbi:regulator [Novimethylophilus kurashikiensis]|uniref:Regulator n=1 Tax=Novimethylophilus kurashikiensis TaxID=1825523 RepID=A0A2R5F8P1_9PROT|nr:hypothetical protein [Novimethylophilus kurashikiensis]GBG14612.1 regulator [Novimethylophilus kurashikiensis]
MSNKFDQKKLAATFRQAGETQRNILGALPGVPWMVAVLFTLMLGVSGLAVSKARTVVADLHGVESAKQAVAYKLNKTPLTDAEYRNVLDWYQRLHPEVTFEVVKEGGLQVSIKDGAKHSDWLYALSALQSRDSDVLWEAQSFCVGRCQSASAVAIIKGYRQKMAQE